MPDKTRSGMVALHGSNWQQYGLQHATVGVPATPVYNADLRAPVTPGNPTEKTCQGEKLVHGFQVVKEEVEPGLGDLIEIPSSPDGEAGHEVVPCLQPADCCSESSESSCEESSSEDEDAGAACSSDDKPRVPSLPDAGWYVNSASLVLHCLRDARSFRCGKPVTVKYIKVRELNGYRCCRCFNV